MHRIITIKQIGNIANHNTGRDRSRPVPTRANIVSCKLICFVFIALQICCFSCQKNKQIETDNKTVSIESGIQHDTTHTSIVPDSIQNVPSDTVQINSDVKGLLFYDSLLGHIVIPGIEINDEFNHSNASLTYDLSKIDSKLNLQIGDLATYYGNIIGNSVFRQDSYLFIKNNPIKIYQKICMNIFQNEDGSGGVQLSDLFPDTIESDWVVRKENENHSFTVLDTSEMIIPELNTDIQDSIQELVEKQVNEGLPVRAVTSYEQYISAIILRLEYGSKRKYIVFSFQYGD